MSLEETPMSVAEVIAQDKPRRWRLVSVFVGLVVTMSLVFLLLPEQDKPQQFITSEISRGDLTIKVTATGTLAPLNQVDVGSEVSGRIEEVLTDFNARVSRGQVLARLNTDEQQAKVVQAQAALQVAQARVLQAAATVLEMRLKLNRCKALAAKGLCTPQDQDAAQASFARANADEASVKAQVVQAQATLDAEKTRLAKSVIHSPIDGIVLKRQVEAGQTVAASLQAPILFTLAENLALMELRVAVDEADIGKVKEGQRATFSVDAHRDQIFSANITQVRLSPMSEEGVVSYETILSLDNKDMLLRPGMTATAQIIVDEIKDVLRVPNAALRFFPPLDDEASKAGFLDQLMPRWGSRERTTRANNKSSKVWVDDGGKARAIEVAVGPSDGVLTQIAAKELTPGMAVITDVASKKHD